jgi:Secretion system C-terminal sorting domain
MRNFIFKQVFLLLLTFFYVFSIKAQTVTISGGCTSVSLVSSTSGGVNFATNLYSKNGNNLSQLGNICTLQALDASLTMGPLFTLQIKSGNSFMDVFVGGSNSTGNFTGLSHGTFRVAMTFPIIRGIISCTKGFATVQNTIGQKIGFEGTYAGQPSFISNEVVVGATLPSEVQYTYIDPTNGMPNGWDVNELMKIDASNSKNYDRWWLAIFEQGGSNRYRSLGWNFGKMSVLDLKDIWNNGSGWQFQQGTYYYVQLAAMTGCNSSWVEATNPVSSSNAFFVCGNNWGCKTVSEYTNMIVSPNPANNTFRVSNVDNISDHRVTLTDLSGRTVKSYSNISNEELDIAELPTGMYLVQLWNGTKKVQTTKLSVVK